MMCRRIFVSILLCIGCLGALYGADPGNINLQAPAITQGSVINGTYFYGPITLTSQYTEPYLGRANTLPFYSLDGGSFWLPAMVVDKSIKLTRNYPVMLTVNPPTSVPNPYSFSLGQKVVFFPDRSFMVIGMQMNYTGVYTDAGNTIKGYNFTGAIYGQRYDAAGVPQGAAIRLIQPVYFTGLAYPRFVNYKYSGFGFKFLYEACPSASGGFVFVWSMDGMAATTAGGSAAGDTGIYGQRFDALGQAVGAKITISASASSSYCSSLSLASLPGGGFAVAATISHPKDPYVPASYPIKMYDANGVQIISSSSYKSSKWFGMPDGGALLSSLMITDYEDADDVDSIRASLIVTRYDASGKMGKSMTLKFTSLVDDSDLKRWLITTYDRYLYDKAKQCYSYNIMPLPDGQFIVAWTEMALSFLWQGPATSLPPAAVYINYPVYMQQFDANCVAVGSKYQAYNSTVYSRPVGMNVMDDGSFILVLAENTAPAQLVLQKYPGLSQVPLVKTLNIPSIYGIKDCKVATDGRIALSSLDLQTVNTNTANIQDEFLYLADQKALTTGTITPQKDIDVRFKLADQAAGVEWFSPSRYYIYTGPEDGKNGNISY